MDVRVQAEPFDPGVELASFEARGVGAVVTFTGVVRGDNGLTALEIEHYPAMTAAAIEAMVVEVRARFGLVAVRVIHRYGRLVVGEPIMMVLTAASHRRGAFEAANFLMDWLKSRAPFWKKEIGPGGAVWVRAKVEDENDLARWTSENATNSS